jgi:hypothetical protein
MEWSILKENLVKVGNCESIDLSKMEEFNEFK